MAKREQKTARSFRLSRSVIALMEQYGKENDLTNTDVVELAIKRLCRQGTAAATQQDIAALAEMIRANQAATLAAIQEQPIQIAGELDKPRRGLLGRLFGK